MIRLKINTIIHIQVFLNFLSSNIILEQLKKQLVENIFSYSGLNY